MNTNRTTGMGLLALIVLGTVAALAVPAMAAAQNLDGTAQGCIVVPLAGGGAKITLVNFSGTHNGAARSYATAILILEPGYVINCRLPGSTLVTVTGTGNFIGV